MKRQNKSRYSYHRLTQAGVSLIELMISVAIGLLLLAALTTLFVNQSRTRSELDKQNQMIDNGRYALDLLSENLRMAGFYGELDPFSVYPTPDEVSAIPASAFNPCTTTATQISQALIWHVQGYNAATTSSVITSPPSCLTSIKSGSDVLVMRRAFTAAIPAASAVANTTYLQVSLCVPKTGLAENVYFVAKAPATYNLSQKTCVLANGGPAADLRRVLVQIYFIDANNEEGDGIPTLKMAELNAASEFVITPLVEGIEYMQVDYGIDGVDTNADGIPDRFNALNPDGTTDTDGTMNGPYISCAACDANQWAHVVAVKISIISRNLETTAGFTDANTYNLGTGGDVTPGGAYKRHAYTQVIRLINPASRKE